MHTPRLIAYYLPQFHPIPENDEWWGKGFTEWTNVTKAVPLFKGHRQPLLPGELGFYDLRLPEVREQQANLAKEYGIESFCYWHYWFGHGKKLLERPFMEMVESGAHDMGFCLAWANQTWGGLSYGDGFERILIEQQYGGPADHEAHFNYLLPAFLDKRYTRIDDKPVFQINSPLHVPELASFMQQWNDLAVRNGLKGIYFIAHELPGFDYKKHGYNGVNFKTPMHLFNRYPQSMIDKMLRKKTKWTKEVLMRYFKKPRLYDYRKVVAVSNYSYLPKDENVFPVAIPNWDHTPRSKRKADIIYNSTPGLFEENLQHCYDYIQANPADKQVIFIKSWNEWAEGNILEPDALHGRGYLEAVRNFLKRVAK